MKKTQKIEMNKIMKEIYGCWSQILTARAKTVDAKHSLKVKHFSLWFRDVLGLNLILNSGKQVKLVPTWLCVVLRSLYKPIANIVFSLAVSIIESVNCQ